MSFNITTVVIAATIGGGVIIAALASYAIYLLLKVRQHKRRQDELETQAAETIRQLGEDVLDSQVRSLKIFTRLILQNEMNLTEGAIRIKVILDHIFTACQRGPYQAIYDLHDKTEHLARSEVRERLSKRERMQQDMQRMTLEAEYQEPVTTAVQTLHDYLEEEYPDIKVIAAA